MRTKILAGWLGATALCLAQPATPKPKLILAITVDQFRYDYLTRFRSEYTGGLHRLLTRGAVFTNARYEHFPTITAIGHSTFLSGAMPALSGIIANEWWDRETSKEITSVSDSRTTIVGGQGGEGSSPRRMLVSTVGDELKIATGGKARVIGISLKDRAAILPAGHMADAAFWFDNKSGNFVSSSYYFDKAPAWAEEFNQSRSSDKYKGAKWLDHTMPAELPALYTALATSPFGNELIEAFAERAAKGAQLGQRGVTDILALSFSSNDYVGHKYGPDSPEARELSVRTDKLLEKLFAFVEGQAGMRNVLVVFTADHGVAPVPEVNTARKMPGGRTEKGAIQNAVQAALAKKYGEGKWVVSPGENSLYLNWELIARKNLPLAEVSREAARAVRAVPHVFRVYTREDLMAPGAFEDRVGRKVKNGFYERRGADLTVLLEPYWLPPATATSATTHGSTFSYDAHVPVIFLGPGVKPGRYHTNIMPNDIAPTLATMLDVETPSGSVGRVLAEMLQ